MDRPDRYWSVMVLDAYTNVAYVCRRLHGADGASVELVLDPSTEPSREAASELSIGDLVIAHLLLQRHGQELYRRSEPDCPACPVRIGCAFARTAS